MANSPVDQTSQYIDNYSYDQALRLKMVELAGSPDGTNIYRARVNPDGSLAVGGFVTKPYDTITPTYGTTSDVYVYSASGVTQNTVTISYTDSTKATIASIART